MRTTATALLLVLLGRGAALARPPKPRKVFLIGAMDACMGRVAQPMVLIAVGAPGDPSLFAGQARSSGSTKRDLVEAAALLEKAAAPPSGHREAALFELGRVRYRLDDNARAAASFAGLLDLPSPRLRAEALTYLAIALSDPCNDGSIEKVRSFLATRGAAEWHVDLWRAVAAVQFDMTRYAMAVDALRVVLQLRPLASDAPSLQATLVDAYLRDRRFDEAAVERQKLRLYGEGTAWHAANRDDAAALQRAAPLVAAAAQKAPLPKQGDTGPTCDTVTPQRQLSALGPRVTACLEEARARLRRPSLTARLHLQLGHLSVTATDARDGDPELITCVVAAAQGLPTSSDAEPCEASATILLE